MPSTANMYNQTFYAYYTIDAIQLNAIEPPVLSARWSSSRMQLFIIPWHLIILHILYPHPPSLSSNISTIGVKTYFATSTAFLISRSNPPYSAPKLSYTSAHPAFAISKLTSLRIPHRQTLTLQTTLSYRSLDSKITRNRLPRT